jgi:hypothetical protein
MAEPEIKNVFVSHYHEDECHIERLKSLLGDGYMLRNYSVTSKKFNNATNEDYIKSLLRPLISEAGTFICLVGEDTHASDWVDWEIRQAEKQGKQIIGIYLHGERDAQLPEALEELADSIVGWNKDNIEAAINGACQFENFDGTTRSSVTCTRFNC